MNIEKRRKKLQKRLRDEVPSIPWQEVEDIVDEYVTRTWPEFLAKHPEVGEKPEAEILRIIHGHFEKAALKPAQEKLKQGKPSADKEALRPNWATLHREPVRVVAEEDIPDPVEGGRRPERIPLRTFQGDIMREAELKGAYCIGHMWSDYKKSVPHFIIQHLFDNVSRGQVHWMEAFEILMIALAGDEVRTPKREDQRLSEYQQREGAKQKNEVEEALAEAARRIHDARVAFSREKSE